MFLNVFVIGFLLFYLTSNTYLAYKFISTFKSVLPVPVWSIVLAWFFLAAFPLVYRNDVGILPGNVTDFFYLLGAYWIALMYYGLLLVLLCDLTGLLQNISGLHLFKQTNQVTGGIVLGILFVLLIYGTYNAANPKVTHYEINVDKAADTDKMRIVLVSDIHLGKINDGRLIDKLTALANPLVPDVVLLAGDTMDSDIFAVYRKRPFDNLGTLQSKYGIYAVMGNHEYIQRNGRSMAAYLEENGIKVLLDSYVELPNGVVLYGRDDFSHGGYPFDLSAVKDKPVIVIDHQPRRLAEAQQQGADLLVSGHTHQGQIFPNNLVTASMYELDYGYKKINELHVIVSNGIGTWGPPIRIGNTPELVCIDITFKK